MIYFIALFIFHIYNLHFLFFRKKLCTYVYRHFSVDIYMCITVYNICLYIINFVCFKLVLGICMHIYTNVYVCICISIYEIFVLKDFKDIKLSCSVKEKFPHF